MRATGKDAGGGLQVASDDGGVFGRVGGAVEGKPDGALEVGRLEDRVAVEGLRGSEDLAREVEPCPLLLISSLS